MNAKNTLKLAGWMALIGFISLHMIFMLLIPLVAGGAYFAWSHRKDQKTVKKLTLFALLIAGIVLAANSFWLVPYALGETRQSVNVEAFDERHLLTFKTEGSAVTAPINVATLYGYWGDDQGRYVVPKDVMPLWPLLAVAIIGLAVYGAAKHWRINKQQTVIMGATTIVGWVLAVGIASPGFEQVTRLLLDYLPFYEGYREPQKFIALVVLGYAFFGGVGAYHLLQKLEEKKADAVGWLAAGLIALPFLYTPTMVWGFAGQLQATVYPTDWYAINERLNQDTDEFKVLFLPWHMYMHFDFAGRTIANPADEFFDQPVIEGDNPEIGLIYRDVASTETLFIEEQVLEPKGAIDNAGERLAEINVKYILVAKTSDWEELGYLNQQQDLELVADSENLLLYQNAAFEDAL